MSKWIRRDDRVMVIAGNDKGKIGVVKSKEEDRVVVQGVNIRKKHVKRRGQARTNTIIDMEMPIHVSNVHLCNEKGESIKPKLKVHKDGSKELVYSKDGKESVLRKLKTQKVK